MLKDSPILITGPARSGTSMVSGCFAACGAWFGESLAGANPSNEKGMFELLPIREDMVKPYLRSIAADPFGQTPLPPLSVPVREDWKEKVMAILATEGYNGKYQWAYKGAKMILMWQVWHHAFPEAKWVITHRPPADVARSCINTHFMRKVEGMAGWTKWAMEHYERASMLATASETCYSVFTDKVAKGDFDSLRRAVEACGLRWNEAAVEDFVDRRLWHS